MHQCLKFWSKMFYFILFLFLFFRQVWPTCACIPTQFLQRKERLASVTLGTPASWTRAFSVWATPSLSPTTSSQADTSMSSTGAFLASLLWISPPFRIFSFELILFLFLVRVDRTNPIGMRGHMAKCYGDLVMELWSGTQKNVAPLKLRVRS